MQILLKSAKSLQQPKRITQIRHGYIFNVKFYIEKNSYAGKTNLILKLHYV